MRSVANFAFAALLLGCDASETDVEIAASPVTLEPGEIKTSEPVGALHGALDIAADGSARYALPLWVPAGRGGIEPSLGLSYSSRGGNGLLGAGWSLGGLSSVTECDRTWAVDGDASSDAPAYCLDGQRLVVVPTTIDLATLPSDCAFGAEYRTLPDTFTRVIRCASAPGNPSGRWYAYARDGRILRFSPFSQTFGTHAYLLTSVSDRGQNTMRVTYVDGSDAPLSIQYTEGAQPTTQPATRTIAFEYEDRDDSITRRRKGRAWTQPKRLKRIRAVVGGRAFRTYDFTYVKSGTSGRSILKTVTACDKEVEAGGTCLPATTFKYTSDLPQHAADPWGADAIEIDGSVHPDFQPGNPLHFVDMTGDGRDDMLFWIDGTWYLRPSTGLSFGAATAQVSGLAGSAILYDVNGDGAVDLVDQTWVTADLDLDGVPETLPGKPGVYLWDFNLGRLVRGSYNLPAVWRSPVYIADLAGDGVPRYVDRASSNKLQVYATPLREPNAPLDSPRVFDHPWDLTLLRDLGGYQGIQFLKTGESTASRVRWLPNNTFTTSVGGFLAASTLGGCPLWGDFNGDGYVDVLDPIARVLWAFDGTTWSSTTGWWSSTVALPGCGAGNYQVADVNGDGKMDVVVLGKRSPFATNEQVKAFVTRPNGVRSDLLAIGVMLTSSDVFADPLPTLYYAKNSRLIDINGEGQFDIFQMTGATTYRIHVPRTPAVDLLTDVTDGLGRADSVSYKSMANAVELTRCYARGCFSGPMQIATQLSLDDGNGTKAQLTHRYANPRVDRKGVGFLGFDVHEVIDQRNGAVLRESYDNLSLASGAPAGAARYARRGLPTEVLSYVKDVPRGRWLVTRTKYTHQPTANNDGATYFINSMFSNAVEYEGTSFTPTAASVPNPQLDCATSPRCPGVTSATLISRFQDALGNVTNLVRTRQVMTPGSQGVFLESTTNTYASPHNDVSRWLIARPTTVKTQSLAPGFGTVTRELAIAYDELGNEIEITRQPGAAGTTLYRRTTLVRDPAWGVVTRVTVATNAAQDDPNARVTTFGYDAQRMHVTSTTRTTGGVAVPELVTSRVVHDALGVTLQTTDAAGIPTSFDHDGFRRSRGTRVAGGPVTTISYASATSPYAMKATRVASSGAREIVYTDRLRRSRRTIQNGFDGRDVSVDTTYDLFGRIRNVTRPYFAGDAIRYAVTYGYDAGGRVIRVGRRDAPGVTLEAETRRYDGNTVTILDELGHRTVEETDGAGHLVRSATAPNGADVFTSFKFGPFDQLRSTADAQNNIVTLEYDELGRQTATVDADTGRVATKYNSFDEPIEVTDAKSVTTTSVYDKLGRLEKRVAPDGIDEFEWDVGANARGKLVRSARGEIATRYAYDALGRLQSERWSFGTETFAYDYEYDAQHRLETLRYPAKGTSPSRFAVRHIYNANGFLAELTNATDPVVQPRIWIADAADAQGRIAQERLGNGILTSYAYEPISNQLLRVKAAGIHDVEYAYTANGLMKARTDHLNAPFGFTSGPPPYGVARTETFTYDTANRLKTATIADRTPNPTHTFVYDDLGNVVASDDQGSCSSRVFGGAGYGPHQLSRVTCFDTVYGISYDANGNETSTVAPDYREQTWTSFNKPREIRSRHGRMLYTYDAQHRRVKKERVPGALSFMSEPQTPRLNDNLSGVWSTTVYAGELYERRAGTTSTIDHVYTVRAGTKTVGQLIWAQSKSNPAVGTDDWRYFHADSQGTVERTTDGAGVLREAQSFDAWGGRRNADWSKLGEAYPPLRTRTTFTGHESDEEFGNTPGGLIHMRGRSYDPFYKRFTSADSIIQAPAFGPSWNRYSYVFNNPLNLVDPTGHAGCIPEDPGCWLPPIEGGTGTGGGGGGRGLDDIDWDGVGEFLEDAATCVLSFFTQCGGGGGRPVGPGASQGGAGTSGSAREATNRMTATAITTTTTGTWGPGRALPFDIRVGRSQTGSYEITFGLWKQAVYRERLESDIGSITSEWGVADLRAGVTFGRSFDRVDLVAKAKVRVHTEDYRGHTQNGALSTGATITVGEAGAQASVGTSGIDARVEASLAKVRGDVEGCVWGICVGAYGEAGITAQLGIAAGLTTGAAVGPFAGYITFRVDDRPLMGDVIRASLGLPPDPAPTPEPASPPSRPLPHTPNGMQIGPFPARSAWPR